MLGKQMLKAAENSLTQSSKIKLTNTWQHWNNGYSANIGFYEAESSLTQTNFINSQITANNGNLNGYRQNIADNNPNNLESGNANLTGVNISAQNINMKHCQQSKPTNQNKTSRIWTLAIGVSVPNGT